MYLFVKFIDTLLKNCVALGAVFINLKLRSQWIT